MNAANVAANATPRSTTFHRGEFNAANERFKNLGDKGDDDDDDDDEARPHRRLVRANPRVSSSVALFGRFAHAVAAARRLRPLAAFGRLFVADAMQEAKNCGRRKEEAPHCAASARRPKSDFSNCRIFLLLLICHINATAAIRARACACASLQQTQDAENFAPRSRARLTCRLLAKKNYLRARVFFCSFIL